MPNGYVRIKKDRRYFRKEHFCLNCGDKLRKVSVSKVVNSHSPEAKDFDFHMFGTKLIGDIQFTWDEFECPSCNKQFSVDEVKKSEGIAVPAPKSKARKLLPYMVALLLFLLFAFLKNKIFS